MPIAITDPGRFHRTQFAAVTRPDGQKVTVWELREPISRNSLGPDEWRIHVTTHGDSLDALAYDFLGDVRLWWVIADLNADVLEDTLRIPAGVRLIMPTESFLVRAGP